MQLYLAPMRGFTDSVYRNVFSRYFDGIDLAIAPFISTMRGDKIKPVHIRGLLPEQNQSMPLIPQILSNDADGFIRLAVYLSDLGYKTLNWNLGCPHSMVANKKRGSGLLPFPVQIDAFLDRVMPAIPNRLSIKTRLGRYDADEIFELLPVFNRYPLEEIIIHPRTGVQMYTGKTDLDRFAMCLEISDHPVVYNGDICSRDDFVRLSARFGRISRWMLGRGVLSDPFLPGTIKRGSVVCTDRIGTLKQFHDDLFEQYRELLSGPSHVVQRMKGLWRYTAQPFPDNGKVLKKIYRARDIDSYRQWVEAFFESASLEKCCSSSVSAP